MRINVLKTSIFVVFNDPYDKLIGANSFKDFLGNIFCIESPLVKNSLLENFGRSSFTKLLQFSIVEYEWIKISALINVLKTSIFVVFNN